MQNSMLPIVLPRQECQILYDDAAACKELEIDLENQEIRRETGEPIKFTVDPFRRNCLLNGVDDIGLTLQKEEAISAFEKYRTEKWPWLDGFVYIKQAMIPTAGGTKKGAKMDW